MKLIINGIQKAKESESIKWTKKATRFAIKTISFESSIRKMRYGKIISKCNKLWPYIIKSLIHGEYPNAPCGQECMRVSARHSVQVQRNAACKV